MQRTGCALWLILASAAAPAQEGARYITDEIAIVLRDAPRADGAARGVVTSGTRVTLVGSEEQAGYVRVRTSDNREGWILQRHLKTGPVARERLQQAEKELAASQEQLKKVRDDHAKLLHDFSRISGGEPLASREVLQEAEVLRAQLKQKDLDVAAFRKAYDAERASQQTLLLGAGLVAAGFLLALLLRWLWPKKRWGNF